MALSSAQMHIVFAMQPRSEHFRNELDCVELDEQFLSDAMTSLCTAANASRLDHPPKAPVAWLIGHGASATSLLNQPRIQSRLGGLKVLTELGPMAHTATPSVLPCFDDSDSRVRRAAADAVGAFGEAAAVYGSGARLVQSLEDHVPLVREAVAHALGCLGESGVQAVGVALSHRDDDVRGLAATALSIAGPKAARYAHILVGWLKQERAPLRIVAAQALGSIGEVSGCEVALALASQVQADDIDENVLEAAIKALGCFGNAAVPYSDLIAAALDNPNPFVQQAASAALESISGSPRSYADLE